jgi:hypothetical protein
MIVSTWSDRLTSSVSVDVDGPAITLRLGGLGAGHVYLHLSFEDAEQILDHLQAALELSEQQTDGRPT